MVWPTAEPTATPAAVVAICAIRPGCFGAGAPTAEAGAAAGTGARAAGAGGAALICGARLQGHKEKKTNTNHCLNPKQAKALCLLAIPPCVTPHVDGTDLVFRGTICAQQGEAGSIIFIYFSNVFFFFLSIFHTPHPKGPRLAALFLGFKARSTQ